MATVRILQKNYNIITKLSSIVNGNTVTLHPKKFANVCYSLGFIVVIYWPFLPIPFRIAALALGQSYDFPSASAATLKDMGQLNHSNQQRTQYITSHCCNACNLG